jgi:hypothetical protein
MLDFAKGSNPFAANFIYGAGDVPIANVLHHSYADSLGAVVPGINRNTASNTLFTTTLSVGTESSPEGSADLLLSISVAHNHFDQTPPLAPEHITATNGGSGVALGWVDTEVDVMSYDVYRSATGEGGWIMIASNVQALTYFDEMGSDTDFYRVVATDAAGNESAASISVAVVPGLYSQWAATYGVGRPLEDCDHDGLDNLAEYALGGNPTNGWVEPAIRADWSLHESGPSNWVEYVYRRRRDAQARGLTYFVEQSDDLVSGFWTNGGVGEPVGVMINDDDFETVTNQLPVTEKGFIRVSIELH